MPQTDVTGDMGPEGKREHLIGSNDLNELRARMRALLEESLDNDTLPPGDWHDEALSLILRLDHSNGEHADSVSEPQRTSWLIPAITIVAAFAALAIITAAFTIRGGWLALIIIVLATIAAFGLAWRRLGKTSPLKSLRKWLAIASAFGIAFGFAGALALYGEQVTQGDCDPNYIPCIPITDDHNCSDIKIAVRVIGEDVYGLDRDGNGIGCESYR
jgi:hypothetical protein